MGKRFDKVEVIVLPVGYIKRTNLLRISLAGIEINVTSYIISVIHILINDIQKPI